MIGGSSLGESRPAIILTDDFKCGLSDKCETFDNPILCGSIDGQFLVSAFEVWGFE
jgi:hypothetical protein